MTASVSNVSERKTGWPPPEQGHRYREVLTEPELPLMVPAS
jgi:hypothetical protein